MNSQRFREIINLCREWAKDFPSMSIKDALFALYDDRMITGVELDVMMHEVDMEARLIRVATGQ